MIRAAQLAQYQRHNAFKGLDNHTPVLSKSLLAQQQQALVDELRKAKYESILVRC